MTDDNRRERIAQEREKGTEAFRAAETLIGVALFNDGVTRLYYAAFHFASAALAACDVQARSHRSLQSLVSLPLVQAGHVSVRTSRDLRHLQSLREAADYDSAFRFDETTAKEEVEVCRNVIADFERFLAPRLTNS